jgi:hypothetical protein
MLLIRRIIFIFAFFYFSTNYPLYQRLSNESKQLPVFKINLDLPIKDRYKEILQIYTDKIKVYAAVTSLLPFPFLTKRFFHFMINKQTQDPDWYEYIEAVSEITGISLNDAVMLSVTYDIACTSVIIQSDNNKIFMGRNLDFGTYFVITHLMYESEYYKNNILLYKGVGLAGFRGGINGMKPGKFSVSLNLRKSNEYRFGSLYRIYEGKLTPNFNLMKVLEKADSYEEALEMLKNNKLSSSVYYSLAGVNKNEGVIISRNYDSIYHIDKLDVNSGKWYLVVTNTDLDKEEIKGEERRCPTQENILKIGKENINYENLFSEVMSVYPTNNLITAYTTIQSAQDNYFNTTLWLP